MIMLVDEDNLLDNVDSLWDELEFNLVDTLRYSGHFPILLGILKYLRYLANFWWILLFRSVFGLRHSGGGDM